MRYRLARPSPSRAALWSGRIARFTLAVLIIGVASHRFGLVDTYTGLTLLGVSWLGAGAALTLGLAGASAIWRFGREGVGQAVAGIVLGTLMLAFPAYYLVLMLATPPLVDVTTDPDERLFFRALPAERPQGANPLAAPPAPAVRLQHAAYPDLRSLRVSAGTEDAFDAALTSAQEAGWRIVASEPPPDGASPGRIEAVARTPIMAYADDVVVRVLPEAGGSRIDVRSVSRFGVRDFGTNARRIRAYLHAVREKVAPTAGGEK